MSKILKLLKIIDRHIRFILPYRIYQPLRYYAKKVCQRARSLSFYWVLKAVAQILLPYRFYMWIKKKRGTYALPIVEEDLSTEDLSQSFIIKKKNCRLVICCAFTGRNGVLAASIQESLYSKYAQEIEWVLCGTTKEDFLFIEAMKNSTSIVSGLVFKNNPLGEKWQRCVSFAASLYNSQLYAIIGSDDIISSHLIDNIIERDTQYKESENIDDIPVLYATTNWITVTSDPSSFAFPQIFQCKILPSSYFQPIGAGRFYKGSFLKKINFQIFDVKLERLLDDLGYYTVKNLNKKIQFYNIEDGPLISLKGSWSQLNTIDNFFKAPTLELMEYSFKGCEEIYKNTSPGTFDFIFKQNDLGQQLCFNRDSNYFMKASVSND